MARKNWNRWFFASTRGQIITLLRRSSRTVDELAQALDLESCTCDLRQLPKFSMNWAD